MPADDVGRSRVNLGHPLAARRRLSISRAPPLAPTGRHASWVSAAAEPSSASRAANATASGARRARRSCGWDSEADPPGRLAIAVESKPWRNCSPTVPHCEDDRALQQRPNLAGAGTSLEDDRWGSNPRLPGPCPVGGLRLAVRNARVCGHFSRVSDGTRTRDRLDHNRSNGVSVRRRGPDSLGCLSLGTSRFRSNCSPNCSPGCVMQRTSSSRRLAWRPSSRFEGPTCAASSSRKAGTAQGLDQAPLRVTNQKLVGQSSAAHRLGVEQADSREVQAPLGATQPVALGLA